MSQGPTERKTQFTLLRLFASVTIFAASLGLIHGALYGIPPTVDLLPALVLVAFGWLAGMCGVFGSIGMLFGRGCQLSIIGLAIGAIIGAVVFVYVVIPALQALDGI